VKVTKDKVENCQAFLTVEMEPAEVEKSKGDAYRRLVKKVTVPGFRKGKAPRDMLERHIGKESLFDEALDILVPQACQDALAEQEIEPYARPSVEITQNDPLVFKATVPLAPTVKLGNYHNIRMEPEPVEITDEKIDAVVERLRHQQATWEPVERPVAYNDLAIFDVESTVEEKPFIAQKGVQYQVLENYPAPVPGFADQLVGMSRDEEKEFTLTLPPDYPQSELAEKEAAFKIKMSEVKEEKLPEVTDDFAKDIDPKYETLELLKKQIADDMRTRAEERSQAEFEGKVIEKLIEDSEIEYPPVLVDIEIDRILEQQYKYLKENGRSLEEYLASINKTQEELREETKPTAEKRVAQALALEELAEKEKTEVSPEEIDADIEEMTKQTPEERKADIKKMLNTPRSRESIKDYLIRRKTVLNLLEIAKGQAPETTEAGTAETTDKEANE